MSKKMLLLAVGIVFCSVQTGWAATVDLAWDANSESDLAGYELHYGTSSGSYTNLKVFGRTATQGSVTGLLEGNTYYFALKAFDSSGNRSGFSNQVSAEIQADEPPAEPLGQPGKPIYIP